MDHTSEAAPITETIAISGRRTDFPARARRRTSRNSSGQTTNAWPCTLRDQKCCSGEAPPASWFW